MATINITDDVSIASVLNVIEEKINKYQAIYIVLSFGKGVEDFERKQVVERIRQHFDIFIILDVSIPQNKSEIEIYFSYGVHGLYFSVSPEGQIESQMELIKYAKEIFPKGWVFSQVPNTRKLIEELLALKIVPVLSEYDEILVDFIKKHDDFKKITSPLIKIVPLLDPPPFELSLGEKIKIKMLLESLNLRQKLMIRGVDDSLTSSGL